ncbi:MAG: ABC transporter ATP-binding protein [Suilimivivens sp.]
MNGENAIVVRNLTKRYKDFLLDNICFEIPKGAVVGFVGENGAGKSTTIKAILGLMPVDGGEIELLGHQIMQDKYEEAWKEEIGVVFDECNFPLTLKVKEIKTVMKNIYRTWDDEKFTDYLTRFGIPQEKKVKELSKGMKMKLSIATALAHDSKLLILDEATGGLDPVIRNEILDLFREFIEDEEHTIFFSSHITSDIEKIADYVMLIHQGQLFFAENKDELLYHYGIVRCTREQASLIPEDIIVGKDENQFETSVLIRDKELLRENGFEGKAKEISHSEPVIDRAGIEDVLLYIVKNKDNSR